MRPETSHRTYNELISRNTNICSVESNGLIEGDKTEGYYKTEKGEVWHSILKKHNDLVGVLTKELSGDRVKRC